jgi:diketogulonate reductase-like aldo/keto reductase
MLGDSLHPGHSSPDKKQGKAMQPARAFTISNRGAAIPAIGYGTMEFPQPDHAPGLVAHAIECGYRHIDTARKYGSEQWVGEGIRATGIAREELFVTTKVTEDNAREADFARSVETSLKTMGLDYVDLLLIHWPQPKVPLAETLGALRRAKSQGLTRHIGVSNFTVALLEEASLICPDELVTNQIEYHAFLRQDKQLAACRRHGLMVTCHAPLARGRLLDDPVIGAAAAAHGKTAAQVALRWLVQQPGIAAVPRALEPVQIEENIDIFDFVLSDAEMESIGALRDNMVRIVDPAVRRPVWDVG